MAKKSQYKILKIIGLGSFGKVFSALDLQTGELVALKELGTKQLSTSDFLQELFCLTTLNHNNIVACRGFEHHQNRRYLIMDYCEGGTLRNLLISDNRVGVLQCLDIVMQILSALEFAHQKNVIHRDIKPANILLKINCAGWDVLLADFGISAIASKLNDNSLGLTGSPAYMAPEQFYGKFSVSSDLYAVGVLLYELVAGERPFNGTPKDLLKAHLSEPVKFPDDIPFLIRNIISIALKKSPDLRFDSAINMRSAVELASKILSNEYHFQPTLFVTDNLELPEEIKVLENNNLTAPIERILELSTLNYLVCNLSFQNQRQLDSQFQEIATREFNISSESKIVDLQTKPQSYVLVQKLTSKYQLIYVDFASNQRFQLKISTNRLFWRLRNFRKQEHLILSYRSSLDLQLHCQVFNTFSFKQLRSFRMTPNLDSLEWDLNPLEILSFNRYYGIAFYQDHQNLKTSLQVFNNRGHWVANFLLKAAITSITANEAFDKFILAIDVYLKRSVCIINLNSFSVERIALAIDPVYIISRQQYFILADRQGGVVIYDVMTQLISQHKFVLSEDCEVRAIACNQNLELIVATWSQKRNQGSIFKGKFLNS